MPFALNPQQVEIVQFFSSSQQITAGAGSGKTAVIAHKVAHIIQQLRKKTESILCITFTNKACQEMRYRISELIGPENTPDNIFTFHSFCAKFLRTEFPNINRPSSFSIYDKKSQLKLILASIQQLQLDEKQFNASKILQTFNLLKNEGITSKEYLDQKDKFYYEPNVGKIFELYEKKLAQHHALDFSDLIIFTNQILETCPQVKKNYHQQFHYILIDEFQDTNIIQYQLVKQLYHTNEFICVVGDGDQNIYAWRGSNSGNLIRFSQDFPNTQTHHLDKNYRSTQTILNAAQSLIRHNEHTLSPIWTDNPIGPPIHCLIAFNEKEEAQFIADEIRTAQTHLHFGLNDFAIFVRTNAQIKIFEACFAELDVPLRIVGGHPFFKREEIRNILAYLHLIHNPDDKFAFSKASSITNLDLVKLLQQLQKDYLKTKSVSQTISSILALSGYGDSLLKENTLESIESYENIQELIAIADQASLPIEEFVSKLSLMTESEQTNESGNAVNIMTFHNAKGLEFKIVFMAGFEEGLMPHYKTQFDTDGIQEERRLCYVGFTRARHQVFLLSTFQRTLYNETWRNDISRFIKELPLETIQIFLSERLSDEKILHQKLHQLKLAYTIRKGISQKNLNPSPELTFCKNEQIEHKIWGRGTVMQVQGSGDKTMLHVQFNDELRIIMLKYAPITKI